MQRMSIACLALVVLVCSSPTMPIAAQSGAMPKDGELVFPSDYKSFPVFLSGVQKPDAVRDLYVNPIGAQNQPGQAFANGSILVMAIYNAKKNAEGALEKGADGNLVKADLAKVLSCKKERDGEKALRRISKTATGFTQRLRPMANVWKLIIRLAVGVIYPWVNPKILCTGMMNILRNECMRLINQSHASFPGSRKNETA